jgi:hypothetical protein
MQPDITITQDAIFTRKVEKFILKHPRIEDSIRGIIWLLKRSPEEGTPLSKPLSPNYRILDIAPPMNGFPGIWVVYKFKNNTITLWDIDYY